MEWRLLVKEHIAKIAEIGIYETLNWPLGRFSILPEMSVCACVFVCLYVCATAKHPLPEIVENSG